MVTRGWPQLLWMQGAGRGRVRGAAIGEGLGRWGLGVAGVVRLLARLPGAGRAWRLRVGGILEGGGGVSV